MSTRMVESVHGIITPRRIEDPPDMMFVAVALPSKNGGMARRMNQGTDGRGRLDVSLDVESFVRVNVLPLKLQEDIRNYLKKRHDEKADGLQLCGETVAEIAQAAERMRS